LKISITTELRDNEVRILENIKEKIKKDTESNWSYGQILIELASMGLENWNRMQLISKITPMERHLGN